MRKRAARSLLLSGVHPTVHLSVTLVYCMQTTEDIVKLLSRPGSPYSFFRPRVPVPSSSLRNKEQHDVKRIHKYVVKYN